MAVRMTFATSFTLANAGGDADVISIAPADDRPCRLRRLLISQSSEVAEAQEECLRFSLLRMQTFSAGSGGGAVTARAVKRMNVTTGAPTVRANDTTRSTDGGTTETLEEIGWNERATPLELRWDDPEDQYDAAQGGALVLYCPTTPADDLTLNVVAVVDVD